MDTVTSTTTWNEAVPGKSPQLDAGDADTGTGEDVTLELADLSAGQLSAVAALMLAFEAAEVRARSAEQRLAAHALHCICRAAEVAAEIAVEEVFEVAAFRAAA
ncbi:MAG: hypothetical protein AB7L18_11375 [Hyphomicrobiaceae bacterium]